MAFAIRFGSYRFDPDTAQLWDEAREIHLTPKAAAVLGVLVSHAGTPVTKEHLFATVWRDTIVSDDALTSCIQEPPPVAAPPKALRRSWGSKVSAGPSEPSSSIQPMPTHYPFSLGAYSTGANANEPGRGVSAP